MEIGTLFYSAYIPICIFVALMKLAPIEVEILLFFCSSEKIKDCSGKRETATEKKL